MLNRKLIMFCAVTCVLCMVSACASENDKTTVSENAANNDVESKTDGDMTEDMTEDITEDITELDDNFEYLYHDALEGAKIEAENETSVQKEYTVEKGDFIKKLSEIGIVEYEDIYYESLVTNEAKDIYYHVVEGDKVKKGDLIATYAPVCNEIDILEQKRDVELMEKEYQAEYNSKKADINMAEYELQMLKKDKSTNSKEIEIKKLQIKKLKLIFEKFKETKAPIETARKELNETMEGNEIDAVYASVDGYVLSLPMVDKDRTYTKGDCVVSITKKEKYHIMIEAREKLDGLKYGTDVTIVVEGGHDGKDIEMKGKVMAAPNILGPDYMSEKTIVHIIDEPAGVNWNNPVKVRYEGQLYKDALKVPIAAVMTEKSPSGEIGEEIPYVYIKNGEAIYKSYINILDENNDYYRVSDGVIEGDTLVCFNK